MSLSKVGSQNKSKPHLAISLPPSFHFQTQVNFLKVKVKPQQHQQQPAGQSEEIWKYQNRNISQLQGLIPTPTAPPALHIKVKYSLLQKVKIRINLS